MHHAFHHLSLKYYNYFIIETPKSQQIFYDIKNLGHKKIYEQLEWVVRLNFESSSETLFLGTLNFEDTYGEYPILDCPRGWLNFEQSKGKAHFCAVLTSEGTISRDVLVGQSNFGLSKTLQIRRFYGVN